MDKNLSILDIDARIGFWLVELVGEAFVSDLEFSFVMHTMVSLEGIDPTDF